MTERSYYTGGDIVQPRSAKEDSFSPLSAFYSMSFFTLKQETSADSKKSISNFFISIWGDRGLIKSTLYCYLVLKIFLSVV